MTVARSGPQHLRCVSLLAELPGDEVCLYRLMQLRFGFRHVCRICHKNSSFHKLIGHRAFSCAHCANKVFPCAGTIFEKSQISLKVWFAAIHLHVAEKSPLKGIATRRALDISYHSLLRIRNEIEKALQSRNGSNLLHRIIESTESRPKDGGKAAGRDIYEARVVAT